MIRNLVEFDGDSVYYWEYSYASHDLCFNPGGGLNNGELRLSYTCELQLAVL